LTYSSYIFTQFDNRRIAEYGKIFLKYTVSEVMKKEDV